MFFLGCKNDSIKITI